MLVYPTGNLCYGPIHPACSTVRLFFYLPKPQNGRGLRRGMMKRWATKKAEEKDWRPVVGKKGGGDGCCQRMNDCYYVCWLRMCTCVRSWTGLLEQCSTASHAKVDKLHLFSQTKNTPPLCLSHCRHRSETSETSTAKEIQFSAQKLACKICMRVSFTFGFCAAFKWMLLDQRGWSRTRTGYWQNELSPSSLGWFGWSQLVRAHR